MITSDHVFELFFLIFPSFNEDLWSPACQNYVPLIWCMQQTMLYYTLLHGWQHKTLCCINRSQRMSGLLHFNYRLFYIFYFNFKWMSHSLNCISVTDLWLKRWRRSSQTSLPYLLLFLCITFSMCTSKHVDSIVFPLWNTLLIFKLTLFLN